MYGSIVVRQDDVLEWVSVLKSAPEHSTFRLHRESDGSVVHMQYSEYNSVRLVVWSEEIEVTAQTAWQTYGRYNVLVPVLSGSSVDVTALCGECSRCPAARREPWQQGRLMNVHTGGCLQQAGASNKTELAECAMVCCSMTMGCLWCHVLVQRGAGSGETMTLLANQQLLHASGRCLGVSSFTIGLVVQWLTCVPC
jgi:hypothetical protein